MLVWGLDAMAVTFVAPHSLHARPLVVPRGLELSRSRTGRRDVPATVLVDGQPVGELAGGERRRRAARRASARCSRCCPRRRSSAATARPLLRRLRIENLVLIREAELELAPGAERDHRRDRRRQDDPRAGDRPAARRERRRGVRRPGRRRRRTSRPSSTCPAGLLDEDELEALAELRPEDEEGVVLARRVFADGRTRAYAWGRSAAREDVAAAAAERLLAMSGQFEQRRLARPSYQLDVLDAFCGDEQLRLRAEAALRLARARRGAAPARRADARRGRRRGAARGAARARRGHRRADGAGDEDDAARRARAAAARHRARGGRGRGGGGARPRTRARARPGSSRRAERALAPVERLAPELAEGGGRAARRRAPAARGGERAALVPRRRSRPSPAGSSRSRPSSTGSPTRKRRFRCETLRGAARARGRGAGRARGARGRRRPGRGGRALRWRRPRSGRRSSRRGSRRTRARRGGAVRGRRRGGAAAASGWARASSGSSSREREPGASGADEARRS